MLSAVKVSKHRKCNISGFGNLDDPYLMVIAVGPLIRNVLGHIAEYLAQLSGIAVISE